MYKILLYIINKNVIYQKTYNNHMDFKESKYTSNEEKFTFLLILTLKINAILTLTHPDRRFKQNMLILLSTCL